MALDYKVIGERIKDSRKEKGYTQRYLSKKMDISVAYISRVERGISKINLTRLTQISKLLNISLSYLLSGAIEEDVKFLDLEFKKALEKCSPERKKVALEVVKLIVQMK